MMVRARMLWRIQSEGVIWKQADILHADITILPINVEVDGWEYGE